MEIKYKNNRQYYFEGYDNYRKATMKVAILKLVVIFIAITILDWFYKYELSSFYDVGIIAYLQPIIIFSIITIIFIFIINKISKKNIENLIDKLIELGTITIEEKIIEIAEDKLIFKGKSHHTEYNMKAFDKVFEKDNVIIICVQKLTPTVIIPKNAFESEETKDEFINLIKEKSVYIK